MALDEPEGAEEDESVNIRSLESREIFESHSCSVSNEADAFGESAPTLGKSVFVYNYYGSGLLKDSEGLFNKLNVAERVPASEPQVWTLDSAKLIHKSGNTDSSFKCAMRRDFLDETSKIQLKVG